MVRDGVLYILLLCLPASACLPLFLEGSLFGVRVLAEQRRIFCVFAWLQRGEERCHWGRGLFCRWLYPYSTMYLILLRELMREWKGGYKAYGFFFCFFFFLIGLGGVFVFIF
ncbi:hypothetical protein FN846DRAFT_648337 [Sphaerosporella brunnea]|uniref:Uncharacterized protein n=1 Tax=Sphaerosporella brunnea TaxID=1250544 RepID=A0A5J5F0Z5_9PEZI|nr:hypothetical protein FN846DRAFT_648337 [Sphaerosporella brunnea]